MEDQQIPPSSNQLDNFFNISFDDAIRAQIRSAASWARICALCAFISAGVGFVVAIFGRSATTLGTDGVAVSGFARTGAILGAFISAAISVFINYWLYRFATTTTKGMDAMDSIKTNEGFNDLRTYFKILGVILIIVLSLFALGVLIGLLSLGSSMR
ncbi:MAG TPA: hypothetical protein VHE34_14930 [Puia sp.]|jgi:hypothetical protein|uniref:hypothetical protein n=1 Tax=Puia sp. TaxID=2045100 RepID=UPI002B53B9EC|nr:hypothetical protein [Puia sp.]HVU96520.1 hypothetical protein [Puia sp.]